MQLKKFISEDGDEVYINPFAIQAVRVFKSCTMVFLDSGHNHNLNQETMSLLHKYGVFENDDMSELHQIETV